MSKAKFTTMFNKQLKTFFKQITDIYPEIKEIKSMKGQLNMALIADETIAIANFYTHLVTKYENQILSQDEQFFLDFDLTGTALADLNHLKNVYQQASPNTKTCIWKYVRVLTLLSKKYSTC